MGPPFYFCGQEYSVQGDADLVFLSGLVLQLSLLLKVRVDQYPDTWSNSSPEINFSMLVCRNQWSGETVAASHRSSLSSEI